MKTKYYSGPKTYNSRAYKIGGTRACLMGRWGGGGRMPGGTKACLMGRWEDAKLPDSAMETQSPDKGDSLIGC